MKNFYKQYDPAQEGKNASIRDYKKTLKSKKK